MLVFISNAKVPDRCALGTLLRKEVRPSVTQNRAWPRQANSVLGRPALPPDGLRSKRVDTNAIFEALRYRISTLQYPPGSALKEIPLAAEFQVSRTPIRQALQRLELSGLVQPVVGHGTIVTSIDLVSVRHLLQYRLSLSKILDQFLEIPADSDALRVLREAQAANADLVRSFDAQRFAEISHDVRWAVWNHIANPFMAQSWIDSYYLASRVWFICLPFEQERFLELQAQEIDSLVEAFGQSDPNAVANVVHETLKSWIAEIWRSIAEGRSPVHLA